MLISAFSFTEIAKRAAALMPQGGALLTLTFAGVNRVMPNYNVMGVAKAALEASVRYLASARLEEIASGRGLQIELRANYDSLSS
jgi:enoyl-[acyl-carrier protein] reductase I